MNARYWHEMSEVERSEHRLRVMAPIDEVAAIIADRELSFPEKIVELEKL